jgi:hypothetical protein
MDKTRKTITIAVLVAAILIIIAGGVWYYFSGVRHTRIEKILSSPGAYTGKEVAIEGEVTDRTAFFITFRFFKLGDKTGEIIVVTKGRTLPEVKSEVRVKGRVDQTFSIGDQKLVVFVAESVDVKERNK